MSALAVDPVGSSTTMAERDWAVDTASTLASLAVAMMIFSGNSSRLPTRLPLDRLLMISALAVLVAFGRHRIRVRVDPRLALWFAVLITYVFVNMIFAGIHLQALYAWLDVLGVIPLLLLVMGPSLWPNRRLLHRFLVVISVTGLYLAGTAWLEGLGFRSLVLPRYIENPLIGIHQDRARGPFLEAAANGLAILQCALLAGFLARVSIGWRRILGIVVVVLSCGGVLFTLTRSVWVGTTAAALIMLVLSPIRVRAKLLVAAGSFLTLVALVAALPVFRDQANQRLDDQRPTWDRINAAGAAWRMIKARPLTGVGWGHFANDMADWVRQSDTIPITNVGIEAHNVYLSIAAETGVPSLALFLFIIVRAHGLPVIRARRELQWWGAVRTAIVASWMITALFVPLSYAFPNAVLWIVLGLQVEYIGSTTDCAVSSDPES